MSLRPRGTQEAVGSAVRMTPLPLWQNRDPGHGQATPAPNSTRLVQETPAPSPASTSKAQTPWSCYGYTLRNGVSCFLSTFQVLKPSTLLWH